MAEGLHELTHRARRRGSAADPWAGLWLGRERFGSTFRALLRADPLRADADICSPVAAWHNPGNQAAYTLAVVEGMINSRSASLFGLGLRLGGAVAPVIAEYANADPAAQWQAAGATAAFVAACAAYGYATRRDLSSWARTLFWALLTLIVFGIVAIFVRSRAATSSTACSDSSSSAGSQSSTSTACAGHQPR
jgi:hypothetical protein